MRILFIGDIVGKPGVDFVIRRLAAYRDQRQIDLVIANGENAADGSGITPAIHRLLTHAGVDCITLGDHIYRRKEAQALLERETNIIKPANFPDQAPGRGWTVVNARDDSQVAVFSLLGRVFMRPVDCPWTTADEVLRQIPAHVKLRILDFHAEATSDMQLMGRYLDGRVTAVLGTHTHVPTADEEIFPGGTAFQCDVGMTGPFESILGRRIDRVMETTLTFRPTRFEVATRDVRMCATLIEADPQTGRAKSIERVVLRNEP